MFPDERAAGKQGSEREKIGLVVTVLRVLDAVSGAPRGCEFGTYPTDGSVDLVFAHRLWHSVIYVNRGGRA